MLNDNWYLVGDGKTVKDLWSADETMQAAAALCMPWHFIPVSTIFVNGRR